MIRRSVLSGSTRKKQKRFKDNLWKIIRKAGGILLKTTLKIRQKSGSSVAKYREEWSDSRLLLSKFLIAKFCHQVFCTSYRISCNIGNCLTPTLSKENMSNNNKRLPSFYFTYWPSKNSIYESRDSLCGVFFSEYFYSLNKEMLNFTNIGKLFTPPPPPPKVSNYKTLLRASGT